MPCRRVGAAGEADVVVVFSGGADDRSPPPPAPTRRLHVIVVVRVPFPLSRCSGLRLRLLRHRSGSGGVRCRVQWPEPVADHARHTWASWRRWQWVRAGARRRRRCCDRRSSVDLPRATGLLPLRHDDHRPVTAFVPTPSNNNRIGEERRGVPGIETTPTDRHLYNKSIIRIASHQMAKNKKGRRNKPVCNPVKDKDRLTTMPNDVLINILERLDTADAIRTCTLCKRMTNLPAELSRIVVDANSFAPNKVAPNLLTLSDLFKMNGALADATDKLLNFRSQQIALRQLSLRFYLRYYDCLTIGKAVQHAMSTYNLETVEFIILTEKQGDFCEETDMLCFGKQFKTFLAAFPDAFAGLTRLQLQYLHFAEPDIPNLLTTCKQLKYLRLFSCLNQDDRAVLRIEHLQLVELDIIYGDFEFVELNCLPKLRRWQKNVRLSQLLSTVTSISDLLLNFESEKIWVHPECPKLLGPVFHKLQRVSFVDVPEGCSIDWTMFILEAAPSLKEICITIWDHWCNMKTEEDRREEGYAEKTDVEWESSAPDGFRHENLSKVTIYGFQPDDNLVGYVRRVMEVAVNLEEVSLYDRKVCEYCGDLDPKIKMKVSPSRYPRTMEKRDLLKNQIAEGLGMGWLDVIHFRS
uniref:F-box domain-containing protein n=1 Tax=Oryza punctata TaxID=4537 RepID=A0A0E0K760_ORYPU